MIFENKEKINNIEEKKDIVDSIKAREIVNEILKFGTNENQIKKIIKFLSLELEDRNLMLRIVEALENEKKIDEIKKPLIEM